MPSFRSDTGLGRIPQAGETVSCPGFEIEVLGMHGPRVVDVRVRRLSVPETDPDDASG